MRIGGTTLVFLLMTALVCGCGLFEPRVPEKPGSGGVPWIPPVEPESVLVNIENSLEGKVIGNYVQCFDTSFVFHPDPADSFELSATNPPVYDNWDLGVEETVTQTILDGAASLRLTFTRRDTTIYVGADECFLYYKYELQVIFKVGGSKFFYGLVDYQLLREGGFWSICMWIDKKDPDYPDHDSWGYFKGTKR